LTFIELNNPCEERHGVALIGIQVILDRHISPMTNTHISI